MAKPERPQQPRDGARWLAISLGGFALIALGLFGAATLTDRATTLESGWIEAENTAALLANHAERALRVAELSTARVASLVAREGMDVPQGSAAMAAMAAAAPDINALELLDPTGLVLASSMPRRVGATEPLAEVMQAIAAGAKSHLSTLGFERPGQVPGFTWSSPIRQDDRLIGLSQATLHAESFAGAAANVALGPNAALALLREDGALLMRWPPQANTAAHPLRPDLAGRRVEAGMDGVDRLVAWHPAPGMPVTAIAALSRDHVLAPFRHRLFRNGILFGLSAALAGAVGATAVAAAKRAEAARRAAEERGLALVTALAEREDLLASLRDGEARLRLAEQAGGVGLWDWDLRDGQLTLIGDAYAGWGVGGRRAMRPALALRGALPEDRTSLAAALAATVRGDGPLETELRLSGLGRIAPGRPRWIALRAELQRDGTGQPRRLLGTALDVTAQREQAEALAEANAMLERRVAERTGALADANARLREGEARFRGIFDATFQVIALLSPDGTVLEANAALREAGLVGRGAVPGADVLGQPYWDAPCWPASDAAGAALRDAVADAAGGRFVRRELSLPTPEGEARAIDVSVKPLRDEDGIVSLLVAEARDVSELKAAQAQLLEAQKMDTLGQLTGGVAHDFNNLLMAVLGNLALARRRLGPTPSLELLHHLDAAVLGAERGAQLTQRLLAFARRQDLRPAAVDLPALLAGMADLLRRSAGPLTAVTVEAPPGLPPAHVDAHALELALMNLAVNARDAMPKGGRLTIRLDEVPDAAPLAGGVSLAAPGVALPPLLPANLAPGRYLRIRFADTGLGMEPATLARAVEPFFSTKGPGQGTGLGLSMVHGLALQSGGALRLDSAPGAGTLATLWLPVADSTPISRVRPLEAEPTPGSGAVLVVDDEPLVLESTCAMLEALGYRPVAAGSGEDALAALESVGDLVAVVTDFAMPGMSGAALAECIALRWPGLPVLLASGQLAVVDDARAETPFGRLAKPYSLTQLASALETALARPAA